MKIIIKLIFLFLITIFHLNADEIQLTGTLRDFHASHPDFEMNKDAQWNGNWGFAGLDQGIVEETLGSDRKPVYKGRFWTSTYIGGFWTDTKSTSNSTNFNQWYNNTAGVNQSMPYTITLQKQGDVYVYDSAVSPVGIKEGVQHVGFFPLDNQLFGNEDNEHNYHMTYEVHSKFTYQGGETFKFSGDDDVWVFIDGKLAVDIGGVHSRIEKSVNLDNLDLTEGESYDFDMFWAERHTVESNFKITTSIELEDTTPPSTSCATVNYSTSGNSWIEGENHQEYSNNLDITKIIEMNNATELRITVNGEIEDGHGYDYDWIYIFDENGNELYKDDGVLDNTPFIVTGNKVTIKLHSDGSVNGSGATIKIEGMGCEGKPISGYIFEDINHNGIKDNGEDGLNQSSYIKLCKADNTFISSVEADSSTGLYTISAVGVGSYRLIEDASNSSDCTTSTDANGYISTTANSINIEVNGTDLLDKNFGNYSGSTVSGYVYYDSDKDGHRDDNEIGIANVDLEIKRCGNIAFATATTDASGHYTFWVPKRNDYADRWVGIWETDLEGYTSTGDEFDNGDGNQIEKSGAEQDHNWLCFSNRMDVNFEQGGQVLVGNNFGDIVDTPSVPFTCSSNSYLTSSNDLFSLNFIDKTSTPLKENYTTENINAIGYNVEDNLIWGWSRSSKKIIQIDANYTVKEFDTDIPPFDFVAGDISKDGVLYLSGYDDSNGSESKFDNHTIYQVQIDDGVPTYVGSVSYSNTNIHFGDYAINPKDDHLYAVDSHSGHLFRVNPDTGEVNDLEKVSGLIDNQTYFHSYVFDSDGNIYFYSDQNNAMVYKVNLSNVTAEDIANPSFTATQFTNIAGIAATGDGARCANAKMPSFLEPTGCIASAFMFQNLHTDVSALNLASGDMALVQLESISDDTINSEGFNKKDGFFWGYNQTKKDGTVVKIGMNPSGKWATKEFKIEGLDGFSSYVGDIDNNGHLYLKEGGSSKRVVIIDLDPNSNSYLTKLSEIQLSKNLTTADWAFNPIDNMLYAVNNGNSNKIKYLYKINPNNGHIIYKKDTNLTEKRTFGAGFFDANGFYYIYDNNTGEIFRIDVANSPIAVPFSTGGVVNKNDGAMCTDIEFKFDFGDLPDNYPTRLENNGARHSLPTYGEPTVYMGSGITHENNGKPSENADLDSNDDGVSLGNYSLQAQTINAGSITPLKITTHGAGYLNAWIDWNGDGDFDDNLEQIASNINGNSGEINLNVVSPSSTNDIVTYARFRYSYQRDLTPTGSADDGEVEDYKITVHADFEPFTCSERLYLSNRTELGIGGEDSGSTWLHGFYAMSPSFVPIGSGFVSDNGGYNAIGYNVQDNFIYALYGNELLKIDKHAKIQNLGVVDGLPNTQLYAGEFDKNGYYYVSGNGADDNQMYKIDIAQREVIKTITLSESVRFWDMAIDTTGEYFYAMLIKDGDSNSDFHNDKFAKIDIETGNITTIGDTHKHEGSYISLIFSDASGKVIAISNDNAMFEIDPSNGKMYWLKPTPSLSYYNDGTSCPDAEFTLPPRMPRLSIGDVEKAEGDSGETIFEFKVSIDAELPMMPIGMPAMFFYRVIDGNGNDITPPHGVATQEDNDFKGGSGIGINMDIFSDDRSQTISVPVYGDTKVEKDEEFYVEIYFPAMFPQNFCMMGKDRGVGVILNDDIELSITRTNGDLNDSSLYTQITGKDFDYSIISHGGNIIENMTLKVKLIDNNATDNILYTSYKYMDSSDRIDIVDEDDLAILRASRDASFRISFLKDENGTIVHGDYATQEAYSEIESKVGYTQTSRDVSDHFAIRPDSYFIKIGDIDEDNNSVTYLNNNIQSNTYFGLVAEYPYILEVNATRYNSQESVANYNSDVNVTLIFDSQANGTKCSSEINISKERGFSSGRLLDSISHNNAGKYLLSVKDKKWTAIDQSSNDNLSGCIMGSHSNIADDRGRVGCNIVSNNGETLFDIKLKFMPYRFDMNSVLSNQNGSTKDYLYMSDLEESADMGVRVDNNIIARGENGTKLTNFSQGCMAEGMLSLDLNYTALLDSGLHYKGEEFNITSIHNKLVFPQQIVALNNSEFSVNDATFLKRIDINATKFNNSELNVSMLYNMQKTFDDPTNPIKVNFISLDLNTTGIKSKMRGEDNSPIGIGNVDANRTFYFARVVSRVSSYPPTDRKSILTPLYAEIFCKKVESDNRWCRDTMNLANLGTTISKTVRGWYLAKEHNSTTDGGVIKLVSDNSDIVTNYTDSIPPFVNGKISGITTNYMSENVEGENKAEIAIYTDIWLRFNRRSVAGTPLGTSSYSVVIQGISSTTGAGNTGHLMQSVQKVEHNGKMSW